MRINGKNISAFGARQWRVTFGQPDTKNDTEWIKGSVLPYFSDNSVAFKELNVTLLIYGNGREQIRNRISDITALLLSTAKLELDGYTRKFTGILTKSNVKEGNDLARHRYQTLELQFDVYEYGQMRSVSAAGSTEITINNPGNVVSPASVIVTPLVGMAELTLAGICRDTDGEDIPVTIKNLTTGKSVVIDGIEGIIEEDGSPKDIDIWALPSLTPGENKITVSSNRTQIEVQVLPIYY